MNFSSASLACTKTTSASPRRAVLSAWPVPWATTLTSMPVLALNSGRMWPNRPESCVEVVEATTIDLSRARTGPAAMRATVAAKTSRLRRVGMVLSSLCSSIAGWATASDQQLASHEAARILGPGVSKECVGRAALDHASAMHEHDLAGEAPRLAEIVRRHHHLDPARSNDADDVLNRLGRGRVEARGRLFEQESDLAASPGHAFAHGRSQAHEQAQ